MADIAVRVESLEHWRDGNGKRGAAATLVEHGEQIVALQDKSACFEERFHKQDVAEAVAKVAEKQFIVEAVEEALRKRSRTAEGLVRAWGPYFASLCTLAAAVLAIVFAKGGS